MVMVERWSGESMESLLKRFKTAVARSGVLGDLKARRHFVSRGERQRAPRARTVNPGADGIIL